MKSVIKVGVVPEFRGDYAFLSNYDTNAPFRWRGIMFWSGEQAFAYAKTFYAKNKKRAEHVQEQIMATTSPGNAKKWGRDREMGLDLELWDAHKIQVMREIVAAKFKQVPEYAGKLLNTGCMMLVEGNDWGDQFWGRSLDKATGQMLGLNMLGVILMEERGRWLHQVYLEGIVR